MQNSQGIPRWAGSCLFYGGLAGVIGCFFAGLIPGLLSVIVWGIVLVAAAKL